MLQHLCEKCGSGKPFTTKNGKTMTVPAGEYQVTDKELMKVFGTDRRKTIGDWRKAIVAPRTVPSLSPRSTRTVCLGP
jgi:hypothetical protein